MMMHIIACGEIKTRVLPYGCFLTRVIKDVGVNLIKDMNFEASSTYDTYDDQSMGIMKFEKALNGFWVRKAQRTPTQARGQGQSHPGVEEEVEIREMKDEVDPQSGHQQRGPELDIPLLQTETPSQIECVQFETTLFEPSYTESSFSGPIFTKPTHTEIPPPQASFVLGHASRMDLFTQISFLGTHMEELAVVNDTRFYSMEDHMDQYQAGFTSQFQDLGGQIQETHTCISFFRSYILDI